MPTNIPADDGDARTFFPALRLCALASFVLLISATVLKLAPWIAMFAGGAPLVYYHLFYLTPKARVGLSQAAIDSVYYFGFLVTIAALGVSAVTLAISEGREPITKIAFQFGLGLLATGYAVFARMHLTSISKWVDEESPEVILDRYVQRSRELVTNVELASTQFVELANTLMKKTQVVAETAQSSTQKTMLETARLFDEQLRSTLASGRQGLADIRALVQDTAFVQEREALARSMKVTLECVLQLNRALLEFSERSLEGGRATQLVSAASLELTSSLGSFAESLKEIGGTDGKMISAARTFEAAHETAAQATQSLGEVAQALGDVGGAVGGLGPTFKNLRTLTSKLHEQVEGLAESTGRLDEATGCITRSAVATQALANGLHRAVESLPQLGERTGELGKHFESLCAASQSVERQFEALPGPTKEAVTVAAELRQVVSGINEALAAAASTADSVRIRGEESLGALERAQRLAENVGQVETATLRLGELLGGLAASAERLNHQVGASTETLQKSLANASIALEADVQRTSGAARLFAERLTDVAQHVIDRTREARLQ